MTSRLALAVLITATACGQRGPEGPAGPVWGGGPSISAVNPAFVAAGTSQTVLLSGFGTDWTDASTVSMGAGISVKKVTVASPTSLAVELTVAADAEPGTRDLVVTQGTQQAKHSGAFLVKPLVEATVLGKLGRGTLAIVRVVHNDPAFAFDLATSGAVTAIAGGGVHAQVVSVSPHQVDVLVLADIGAPRGNRDFELTDRTRQLAEKTFRFPNLLEVFDVDATDLLPGMPATGTLGLPFASKLFKYTPPSTPAVSYVMTITSNAPGSLPRFITLPSSGLAHQLAGPYESILVRQDPSDPLYVIAFDLNGMSGVDYTLDLKSAPVEVEPNDMPEQASSIATPFNTPTLINGQFSALGDIDYFKVVIGANDVGKKLRVISRAGDANCDTIVDVQNDLGTSQGGPSADNVIFDQLISAPLPTPGTYFVKVYFSPQVGLWDENKSHYQLVVSLVP